MAFIFFFPVWIQLLFKILIKFYVKLALFRSHYMNQILLDI